MRILKLAEALLMDFCIRELRYGVQLLLITLPVYKSLEECCCNNVINFIDFFQRGPREKEANYLMFTIQRSGDLTHVPSLRPHAVFYLDIDKPTVYRVGTLLPSQIQQSSITRTLDEYTVGVRRGT